MSNRKKTRKEKQDKFLARLKGDTGIDLGRVISAPPVEEKVLVKTVPAVIHWKDWDAVDRDDDEIIGETFLYEDGTFDMVVNRDISQEAKAFANSIQRQNPGAISLKED